jgi:uncharacterized protein
MKIVIDDLFIDKDFESFSEKIDISIIGFEKFLVKRFGSCDVEVNIYLINDNKFIDFKYEIDVVYSCSRCLTAVTKHMSESFSREILNEGDKFGEDIGVLIINNGVIDINEILIESLYMNLEPSILCSEDCKGLCPKCGTNLNEGKCDCNLHEADPRFSKLISLKDKLDK